jgi:hypothetical protein
VLCILHLSHSTSTSMCDVMPMCSPMLNLVAPG